MARDILLQQRRLRMYSPQTLDAAVMLVTLLSGMAAVGQANEHAQANCLTASSYTSREKHNSQAFKVSEKTATQTSRTNGEFNTGREKRK